jgi:hypothetical protein
MESQFRQHVLDMTADRGHADRQLLRDHAVIQANPYQGQYLELSFGQPTDNVRASALLQRLRPLVLDDSPQRVRGQQELSGGGPVQSGHERIETVLLKVHQPGRACCHEAVQALVIDSRGQDYHASLGTACHDLLDERGSCVTVSSLPDEDHVRQVSQQVLSRREISPDAYYPDACHRVQRALQGLVYDQQPADDQNPDDGRQVHLGHQLSPTPQAERE